MASVSMNQVLQAIQALYGHHGPDQQQQANQFLMCFSESEEAWQVGISLLSEPALSQEVQYFASNMIYTKAQRNWKELSPAHQQTIGETLLRFISQAAQTASSTPQLSALSIKRVCLAMAVISMSTPGAAQNYIHVALQHAARGDIHSIHIALEILLAIGEELETLNISFTRKEEIGVELQSSQTEVLSFLESVFTRFSASADLKEIHYITLQTLYLWFKLCKISLCDVFQANKELLNHLLQVLQNPSSVSTSSVFVQVCKVLTYLVSADDSNHDIVTLDNAIATLVNNLVSVIPHYNHFIQSYEEECTHALTSLVAEVAEEHVDWIVNGSPEALQFLDFIMLCTSHPKRQIASIMLEFWLIVQEIPVVERHRALQQPAYLQLLEIIIQQCAYPDHFNGNWEDYDGELSEDDLKAFRSGTQGVGDVLISTYSLLRYQYIEKVVSFMTSNIDSWQRIEACMYSIIGVSVELRKRLQAKSIDGPNIVQDKRATEETLQQLVGELCSNPKFSTNGIAIMTICKFLGEFSGWMNKKEFSIASNNGGDTQPLLCRVVQYLTSALRVSQSQEAASFGLRQISCSCSKYMNNLKLIEVVISAMENAILSGLAIENRLAITEGVARASVSYESDRCKELLQILIGPVVGRLEHSFNHGKDMGEDLPSYVSNELQSLGVILRFLDTVAESDHNNIALEVLNSVWGHMQRCASEFKDHSIVLDALFDAIGWALRAVKNNMADKMPLLAQLIVASYQCFQCPKALDCTAIAVDVFGKFADESITSSFRSLLSMLNQVSFEYFQKIPPAESPELVQAFFDMMYRFALFCPAAIFTTSEFSTILQLSVFCLESNHREATRSILIFLSYIISKSNATLLSYKDQIDSSISMHSEPLIQSIIMSIAVRSPSSLYSNLAEIFFSILSVYGENLRPALVRVLSNDATGVGALKPADKELSMQVFFRMSAGGQKQRFRALVSDFAKICRGQMTADVLVSYQM